MVIILALTISTISLFWNKFPLPIFLSESSDGTIRRINYSQPQRDSHMAVPIDQVENWYRGLQKFYDLALDPQYLVTFKLQPGNARCHDYF